MFLKDRVGYCWNFTDLDSDFGCAKRFQFLLIPHFDSNIFGGQTPEFFLWSSFLFHAKENGVTRLAVPCTIAGACSGKVLAEVDALGSETARCQTHYNCSHRCLAALNICQIWRAIWLVVFFPLQIEATLLTVFHGCSYALWLPLWHASHAR